MQSVHDYIKLAAWICGKLVCVFWQKRKNALVALVALAALVALVALVALAVLAVLAALAVLLLFC